MAVTLKKTDVVIVGLGAVGGVAALPLAQAGLEVIALEAGAWLSTRNFAPDELRNNVRGWPQSVQKANGEIPTHRRTAAAPYSPRQSVHPMMNAVGGTTLHYWGQSWRLNPWDFKLVSETTRRYGASRIPPARPSRTGRSDWRSSSLTTTKWSMRSGCRARPEISTGRSTRAATSSRGRAAVNIRCLPSGVRGSPKG